MLFLVVILGALLGDVVAEALSAYPSLAFLTRDIRWGIDPPFTAHLSIVRLTLGAFFRVNLAMVLGVILAVWLLRLFV